MRHVISGKRLSRCLRLWGEAQLSCWAPEVNMSAQSRQHTKRQQLLTERAKEMKFNPTWSERVLWEALRGCRLGVAFRRQVPIGGKYIADFLAPAIRLVLEVDGGVHRQRGVADERRDRNFRRLGYTVVRVDADQVTRELGRVIEAIRVAIRCSSR